MPKHCPVAVLILVMLCPALAMAEDWGPTARGLFAMLPTSIFENTAEGMSDQEKAELLREGQSEFWEIAGEDSNVLVLSSLPLHERAIAVRVFHNGGDGSTLAAIGTLGSPVCVLELWRLDSSGRLVPVETPEEPDAREFLAPKGKMPPRVNPSVFICLGPDGLEAHPIFWRGNGLVELPLARSIRYAWTGNDFKKVAGPAVEPVTRQK